MSGMSKLLKKERNQHELMTLAQEGEMPSVLTADDFTHDEKVRLATLGIACRYYIETICKDGELYREMVRDGKTLSPCSYQKLLEIAWAMEMFVSGKVGSAQLEEKEPEDIQAPADAAPTKP